MWKQIIKPADGESCDVNNILKKRCQMVHSMIRIAIPSDLHAEAKRILMPVLERTRLKPGCISCHLYQDFEENLVIMMDELWMNQAAIEKHLLSEDYLKILLVVEMAYKMPEISFNMISQTTGMNWIEKIRLEQLRYRPEDASPGIEKFGIE
jgi:quinol monooxygenase YgiN